ncbi:MAG TPA: hypothetical protein ENJ68_05550, partial [Devosia sp.]|nr:hypothetical protein [Devosia sp.]
MPFDTLPLSRRSAMTLLAAAIVSLPPQNIKAANPGTGARAPLVVPDRGVNIPLWLDQPDGTGIPPSSRVLELLSGLGFEHVRLPVDPDPFLGTTSSPDNARRALRTAIEQIGSSGFSLTLDMHPSGAIGTALASGPGAENALNAAWDIVSRIV